MKASAITHLQRRVTAHPTRGDVVDAVQFKGAKADRRLGGIGQG